MQIPGSACPLRAIFDDQDRARGQFHYPPCGAAKQQTRQARQTGLAVRTNYDEVDTRRRRHFDDSLKSSFATDTPVAGFGEGSVLIP